MKFDILFKFSLAIILPIMLVAPPFEQTLFAHTQGLFVSKNFVE